MSSLWRGPSIDASYQVSEEKIKMWKVNGRQTMDAKWWQKLTLPLARWAKNSGIMKDLKTKVNQSKCNIQILDKSDKENH
jgi:hypothetical protein